MAYASIETVRQLAVNKRSDLSPERFAAIAEFVDVEIDQCVAHRHFWPFSAAGVDLRVSPPTFITSLANLMTAACLEQNATAFASGPEQEQHPYGVMLQRRAVRRLNAIREGTEAVIGLDTRPVMKVLAPVPTLRPMTGLRGGSLGNYFSR